MTLRATGRMLAALLATTAFCPGAIAGEIAGRVLDSSSTRALQSARIVIREIGRTTETGRDGSFLITDLPAGSYTIEAQYVGAEPASRTVSVPAEGRVDLDFALVGFGEADVLVIGQIANQASALQRQRAADGVQSVLTRDAIGQFPDQNVAESLRRLPGLNILNDQGEGRFVSVRGLDPELNSASVNGVRLPAPESDVRSVALDVISSDIIESIEVKKSLTPDMDADTIGASIEINTTSAFDRTKDLFAVKAEGSYNDLTNELSPKGSIDFATRLSDSVGIAGGLSYYRRVFATNNLEMDGWDEDDGTVYADTVEYRDYDVERERISGSLSFDFRVGDTTTLYARGLYSQFDDQEYRRRLIFEMDEAPSAATATSATFDAQDGEISVQRDLKDRFERQRIGSLVLGGETETGPWRFTYSGSWAKASERENGSIDPVVFERKFEDETFQVRFDYADEMRAPYSVLAGQAAFLDPSEYELDKVERTTLSDAQDEEWSLKADLARTFAMAGGEFTLQAGAKARWREKRYDAQIDVFEWDGSGDLTLAETGLVGPQDYDLATIDPVPGKTAFATYFKGALGSFELDDGDTFEQSNASDFRVKEDVTAAYLLGRWDSATLRVIGGLRMEHTSNHIQGQSVDLDDETVTPITVNRSYTDWLPSLSLRYEPVDGVILRAAGYKSLVRPKLSQLAPRTVIEDDEGEFGNPDLLPYRAWNMDLAVDYYFGRNAALSAGFFHKEIDNFTYVQVIEDYVFNGRTLDEAQIPMNGASATITGVELSYSQLFDFLPAPFDGLLAQVNYTYTDASGSVLTDGDVTDPRDIPLAASSPHTLNVVLGYEKGPVSLRAAATYRDKYLDEVGDTAEEDRYVSDHLQLDLSAKYRIIDGVRVFAEWINVTNEPYFAYQNFESRRRLLQYEDYSWTLKFGVAASF